MKKIFLSLLLFFVVISVKAQNSGSSSSSSSEAAEIGQNVCDCISNVFKKLNLHPRMMQLMHDMVKLGEQRATELFMEDMATMSAEDQARMISDGQKMQGLGDMGFEDMSKDVPACNTLQEMKGKYKGNNELQAEVMNYLKNQAGCELTYMILQKELEERKTEDY